MDKNISTCHEGYGKRVDHVNGGNKHNEFIYGSRARNTNHQTYGEHFIFEEYWKILRDNNKWPTWSVKPGEPIASRPSASSKRSSANVFPIKLNEGTFETDPLPASLHTASVGTDTPHSMAPSATSSVTGNTWLFGLPLKLLNLGFSFLDIL